MTSSTFRRSPISSQTISSRLLCGHDKVARVLPDDNPENVVAATDLIDSFVFEV